MRTKKIIKKIYLLLLFALFLLSNCFVCLSKKIINDNDPLSYINKDIEEEKSNREVQNEINNFYDKYIKSEMCDFEKEIAIIKYLVATVSYDFSVKEGDSSSDSYKAYGALVNKKAVCLGYAKAFNLLCDRCNIECCLITGIATDENGESGFHAWNQICLDNEWYNVDVTWEDPNAENDYGFNKLRNEYINITDSECDKTHEADTVTGHICYSTKYGKKTVTYYLVTNIVDVNADLDLLRKSLVMQAQNYELGSDKLNNTIKLLNQVGAKYDDNSNYFPDNDNKKINEYINNLRRTGNTVIPIATGIKSYGTLDIDKEGWLDKNVTENITISMHIQYFEGKEYDARYVIFKY